MSANQDPQLSKSAVYEALNDIVSELTKSNWSDVIKVEELVTPIKDSALQAHIKQLALMSKAILQAAECSAQLSGRNQIDEEDLAKVNQAFQSEAAKIFLQRW